MEKKLICLHDITKTVESALFLFEYNCYGKGNGWYGVNQILIRTWLVVEYIK